MKLSGGAYLNVRSGLLASLALVLTSIMFGLMACANPVYHDGAMQVGARRYPGEFIDVGGYKLFVSCSGAGPYTVVFETGGGGVHLLGLRVQKRLRADPDFQVCSYDRAGHGWSESASGPYEHPRSPHPRWRLLRRFFHQKLCREKSLGRYWSGLPGCEQPLLFRSTPIEMSSTRKYVNAVVRYARGFPRSLETVRRSHPSRDIPVVVISRGLRDSHDPWTTVEREEDWRKGQRTLLGDSNDGQLIIATQSGHEIPLSEPDIVVDARSKDRRQS